MPRGGLVDDGRYEAGPGVQRDVGFGPVLDLALPAIDGPDRLDKTLKEELGTPGKLMDERMGHEDGSIQARYSHVTAPMRAQLLDGLTERWEAVLAARRAMAPGSPVAVLDRLLRKEA
jgi:hypothetical protein